VDLTTHPFLNIIWSFFIIFIWISWFMLLFRIIADVFRRSDIGGGMKAVWTILVIFLPLIGSLIYLISQGGSMASRDMEQAKAAQSQMDDYIRERAGSGGAAAEIERAKALLDSGAIDQAEFQTIKTRALA
jgi:Phospholipase_D-nuclease N-terminal/Short C-terminal domain